MKAPFQNLGCLPQALSSGYADREKGSCPFCCQLAAELVELPAPWTLTHGQSTERCAAVPLVAALGVRLDRLLQDQRLHLPSWVSSFDNENVRSAWATVGGQAASSSLGLRCQGGPPRRPDDQEVFDTGCAGWAPGCQGHPQGNAWAQPPMPQSFSFQGSLGCGRWVDFDNTQFCWASIDVWDPPSGVWDAKRHAAYFDSYVDSNTGGRCGCCSLVFTIYVRDYASTENAVRDCAFIVRPLLGATGASC